MSELTLQIKNVIQYTLENRTPTMPASTHEVEQATRYIQHLLNNTFESPESLETLKQSLIRFFKIRPAIFNLTDSPVSKIYMLLNATKILPQEAQTPEEALLCQFTAALFEPAPKNTKGGYKPLTTIDIDNDLIYKIICNVEPGIIQLTPPSGHFEWNPITSFVTHNTRLHDAVITNDIPMIKLLLATSANINARNRIGISPLDAVIHFRHENAVILFVTYPGITLSENNLAGLFEVFLRAIKSENSALTENILLIKELDKKSFVNRVSLKGAKALNFSAIIGNAKVTKFLLDNEADPDTADKRKNTPLSLTAGQSKNEIKPEHDEIALLLIEAMTPTFVNKKTQENRTALEWAFYQSNQRTSLQLVQYKDIVLHDTALIDAVTKGWVDVMAAIMNTAQGKLLINKKDSYKRTPIKCAFRENNQEAALLLVQSVEINLDDQYNGKTIDKLAEEKNWDDVCKVIADKRLQISVVEDKTNEGLTKQTEALRKSIAVRDERIVALEVQLSTSSIVTKTVMMSRSTSPFTEIELSSGTTLAQRSASIPSQK